jgi:hypothetical protein
MAVGTVSWRPYRFHQCPFEEWTRQLLAPFPKFQKTGALVSIKTSFQIFSRPNFRRKANPWTYPTADKEEFLKNSSSSIAVDTSAVSAIAARDGKIDSDYSHRVWSEAVQK